MPRAGFIRIISTPEGEAPPDIRSEWVGLALPVNEMRAFMVEPNGILSGGLMPAMVGYIVLGKAAVDILDKKCPWAAGWWREEAPHVVVNGYLLVFPVEACKID